MLKELKVKTVYPILSDQDFREFMTESKESVWECQVSSKHSNRYEDIAIIKLSVKDAKEIPFIAMSYNKEVYRATSFGKINNQEVDGVYLVDEDAIIFSSNYISKDFRPHITEIKVHTSEELKENMEQHLQQHLKEAVTLSKLLGAEPNREHENINIIADWYVRGNKPIDFIGRNTELIRAFRYNRLSYMIKFVRGEDIVQEGLKDLDIDHHASVLAFVEQKYQEYDSCDEMQRNVELLRVLKEELGSAVNVTVVKKDGSSVKVENSVRTMDGSFKIGRYSQEVYFADIDCFMYKKKIYGKTA